MKIRLSTDEIIEEFSYASTLLNSTVQSLTMGLKIRNSSQTFSTSFTACSAVFALTWNFNVFALLTDSTFE